MHSISINKLGFVKLEISALTMIFQESDEF